MRSTSNCCVPEPHRKWIIVKARPEDIESITAWIKKLDRPMLTVAADDSLDKIENKKDVVQRFVKLKHCSVDRMVAIVTPLLGDTARVMPEPTTGSLMVVDTVENLLRIEKIVAEFDVPQRTTPSPRSSSCSSASRRRSATRWGPSGDNSPLHRVHQHDGVYRQNWDWAGRAMPGTFPQRRPERTASNRRRGQPSSPCSSSPSPIAVDHRQSPAGRYGADRRLDQAAR
jgi:hypothetical protein